MEAQLCNTKSGTGKPGPPQRLKLLAGKSTNFQVACVHQYLRSLKAGAIRFRYTGGYHPAWRN